MTTETSEVTTQSSDVHDGPQGDSDVDFDAGFDGVEQAATPGSAEQSHHQGTQDGAGATAEALPQTRLAQITEDQFKALMQKADEVDQIRSDSKRQIDTLAGHLGGMKQLVEGLKQQRGPLSAGQLKRLGAEYPDVARLLQEDLGALGAAGGQTLDSAEVDRRAQAIVAQQLPKELVKQEIKILRLYHRDWVDVVRSPEFADWSRTLSVADQQRLAGNDGEFIADRISDFKARPKPRSAAQTAVSSNSRQRRLEAAVSPKGAGGHAPAPAAEDDFEAGFRAG